MSDMPDFHSNKEPFEVVFSPWREDLAKRIIKRLHEKGVQVWYSQMKYNTFATGEILPDVPQSVRGKHVYFLHDLLAEDPNIALMRYILRPTPSLVLMSLQSSASSRISRICDRIAESRTASI
jgi:phosphoribosylpyrophosphate synthetase